MDLVEGMERDREGSRLSGREVQGDRVSEVETETEMSAMMKGYDVIHSGEEDERSPPRLELVDQYRSYVQNRTTQSPPIRRTLPSPPSISPTPLSNLPAMDISSVRIRPVQAMAQAVMTSTHGHPRPNWPTVAKLNNKLFGNNVESV